MSYRIDLLPERARPTRRAFALGAATAFSLSRFARAQNKRPLIGVLTLNESAAIKELSRPLFDALAGLGYIDGKTATIAARYAAGDTAVLPKLAAELASLRPDVIVADTASPIRALKAAAPDVPIVGAIMVYPVEQGLIASFAHPGGNLTGVAATVEDMDSKLLDLALEAKPGIKSVGLLLNPTGGLDTIDKNYYAAAAARRGLVVQTAEASLPADIDGAMDSLIRNGAGLIIAQQNGMLFQERQKIGAIALSRTVPVVTLQSIAEPGYLLIYGPDIDANLRTAAGYVDNILRGAKPADLPVQFPTKIKVTVNLKTAQALGIALPQTLLIQADQVIE